MLRESELIVRIGVGISQRPRTKKHTPMETNGTEILKKSADYWNWERLIEHCDTLEELTAFEKEMAKRAFRRLRQELGEDFFKDAFKDRNPVCQYISNRAPWTRKWITWFADALMELKDHENYSSLLERLKNPSKFYEGLSVLEVAFKFSKAGFRIHVDPSVEVEGRLKQPDVKLADKETKEQLFVEVSALQQSKGDRDALRTLQGIAESTWRSGSSLWHCGRIHKALSTAHLNSLITKIREAVKKLEEKGGFDQIVVEKVIELGLATRDSREVLDKWAAERGFEVNTISGPPPEVNQLARTRGKIRKEQQQLPRDFPALLVIRNEGLFLHSGNLKRAISGLEEEVYEYPHLLAVVVTGGYGGTAEKATTTNGQHMFITNPRPYLYVEQHLVLFNRFCKLKISPCTITNMYDAFRNH